MTDKKTVIFGGIECDTAKADSLLLEEIIPMAIRVAESLAKDGCKKEKIVEGTAAAVEAVIKSLEGVALKGEPKTDSNIEPVVIGEFLVRLGFDVIPDLDPAARAIIKMEKERIKIFGSLYQEDSERVGEPSVHDRIKRDYHPSSHLPSGDFLVQVSCEQLSFALRLKPTEQK